MYRRFGSQEPGTETEIVEFCKRTYNVEFPMMQKVEVNGDDAHPVYKWLKDQKSGLLGMTRIKWNFEVREKGQGVLRTRMWFIRVFSIVSSKCPSFATGSSHLRRLLSLQQLPIDCVSPKVISDRFAFLFSDTFPEVSG